MEEYSLSKNCKGFVRFYKPTGKSSLTFLLTTNTTVKELCETYAFSSVYLHIGNAHIR